MATNSDSNAREVKDATVSQSSSFSITQSQLASAQSKRRHLKRKRVKRLEKKLELYQRKIKQAMETEVSLEEMNSDTSAYLKEDLLKRKLVKTWYELCEVLRLSPEIQSYTEYNQKYDSTPYPPINRSVERLLKMDTFPDYWDIVHLIEKQNEKHGLGIKDKETQLLARRVFQEVGEIIKANRQKAWSSLFACYLVDNEEDPAVCEPELSKILEESNELGRQRLNEMLDEFAARQEREGDKTGSSSNGEEEEEDGDKESNEFNDGEIASKRLKVDEENEDKTNVILETDIDGVPTSVEVTNRDRYNETTTVSTPLSDDNTSEGSNHRDALVNKDNTDEVIILDSSSEDDNVSENNHHHHDDDIDDIDDDVIVISD